jgi:hypothetical protein
MSTTIKDPSVRTTEFLGQRKAPGVETSGLPGSDDIRMPVDALGHVENENNEILDYRNYVANYGTQSTADKALELGLKNQTDIDKLKAKTTEQDNVGTKSSSHGLLKDTVKGTFITLIGLVGEATTAAISGSGILGGIAGGALSSLTAAGCAKDDKSRVTDTCMGFIIPLAAQLTTVGMDLLVPGAVAALGGPIPVTIAAGAVIWLLYKH